MILKIKKWWWKREGYKPIRIFKFEMWKVGVTGSIQGVEPFIVRGLEPPDKIWVEMKK